MNDPKVQEIMKKVQKYLNTPIDEVPMSALTENWDWRNVDGISFVPPVSD